MASAVPLMLGVVTLVMPSPSVPLSLAAAKVSPPGGIGAVVSMVRVVTALATEVLPARVTCLVVSEWLPWLNALLVMLQIPDELTTALPSTVVPSVS